MEGEHWGAVPTDLKVQKLIQSMGLLMIQPWQSPGSKERLGLKAATRYAVDMETVGVGISLIGTGMNRCLGARTGINSTGILTSLLSTWKGLEVLMSSRRPAPTLCLGEVENSPQDVEWS